MLITKLFDFNNYTFNLSGIPHILTICIIFLMTIQIIIKERLSATSITFTFIAFAINMWVLGVVALLFLNNESLVQYWANVLTSGVTCIPIAAFLFIMSTLNKLKYYNPVV